MLEIGIGLVVGSCWSLFKHLSFPSSFSLSNSFLAACKSLNLVQTYGDEFALPSVNKTIAYPWGQRLLVGLPVGLSSAKVIDQHRALAEAMRVPAEDVEMRYANDGLIIDIFTRPMPETVPFESVNKGGGYNVPIGVNKRGEIRYYDFGGPYPHLLIGGISGGGKSVLLRAILSSLATGANPYMYLCDLKGGVELGIFRELECVRGFATSLTEVRSAAQAVENEMQRRYAEMAEAGAQSWTGNKTLLVVDELADFKARSGDPDAKLKGEIKAILTRLSAKGRAAGVLLVLATQRPSADVVDGLIKTNIAASVGFRTRDGTQSRIILDHDGAADLPDIPGRLIFQTSRDETLQAPYLSAADARQLIAVLPKKSRIINEEAAPHADAKPDTSEADPLDGNSIEL
ncbi:MULTISPECIES: FtsK/SpoIIIE domain-containing protein [Paenibacillus]|uniref:FtsK/SpoIIIE domain-containing protein n=1 Tax=Paenibacillus TaxID=44249 RepID=UPI000434F3A7|nr:MULTISPECIES: FtsK/SpoIIIE domain-containing protein [Paenibacillus]CDN42193.1 hypothetical protein BN871_AY_00360 [Paenibacillus sp. P22]